MPYSEFLNKAGTNRVTSNLDGLAKSVLNDAMKSLSFSGWPVGDGRPKESGRSGLTPTSGAKIGSSLKSV
jgi:hypothetical protein